MMLQKLLHSREDDGDPEALMGGGMSSDRQSQSYKFRWWHVAVVIAILFPYISIFALFGIVAQQGSTKKYYTTEEVSVTTSYSTTWPASYSSGTAVSFDSAGQIQKGAGTTFYNDVLSSMVGAGQCPAYTSMDSVGSGRLLASYAHTSNFTSTLLLIDNAAAPNEASILASMPVDFFIYEVAVLDASAGWFVCVCQDYSNTTETAVVFAGRIVGDAITIYSDSAVQYAANFSVSPDLLRLSNSGFALGYYTNTSSLSARYGLLDTVTSSLSLSEAFDFSVNNGYYYFSLAALSSTSFLATYYDSLEQGVEERGGALNALL
ncbi:hypothetical protein EON64_06560 [archaeon]|nr:MAG: hypothetical protein EON64_06560 [archaeon]